MKKLYQLLILILLVLSWGWTDVIADIPIITIRDLNTYEQPLTSLDDIPDHPLADSLVQFTALVSSYPRNSGLASYSADTDAINRIHVFVIDTTAYSQGRDGMAMQLVVAGEGLTTLENLDRGDIITMRGDLQFFGNVAQFNTDDVEVVGNAWFDTEYEKYQTLLEPWVIPLSELNAQMEGGMGARLENYTKYHAQYIKIEDGVVVNRITNDTPGSGGRPWMYIGQDGVFAYNRDTSLRFRNDRNPVYRAGYNYRRIDGEDGVYNPPSPGAVINYSGYIVVNTFDPDNLQAPNTSSFAIVAMEDGVRWLGERDDAVRFTNENLPPGFPYQIPNDLGVVGFPPVISNYSISSLTPAPSEQVEITFDAAAAEEGVTLVKVELVYRVNGDEFREEITGSGSYSYTFPAFDDLTTVSFEILATDDRNITGRLRDGDLDEDNEPLTLKFVVLESALDAISRLTMTPDGERGPSPMFRLGMVPMDITAVVVADSLDGFIVIHDKAEPWSGIFIEADGNAGNLRRGDRIKLTASEVGNTNTNPSFNHLPYLINPEYEILEREVDYSEYIPVVTTTDVAGPESNTTSYEAMALRFEDVHVVTNQADAPGSDFGEWLFASGLPEDGHPAVRVRFNMAQNSLRTLANFTQSYNDDIKSGAMLEYVQGVMGFSFGNNKLTMRKPDDVKPVDDMFYPNRIFPLFLPANNSKFTVSKNLNAQWASTTDRDGDEVRYSFALTSPDDTGFDNPLFMGPSHNNGRQTRVIVHYDDLDQLLASQGVEVGQSLDFIWTVMASDGRDTVQVSTKTGPVFNPVHRTITLERAEKTSAEDSQHPKQFALEQNYPNPFNPATQIRYDVPNQAHVRIAIYDILGRQVHMLVNEEMTPGRYTVEFDATRMASGVYIYRMQAGSFVQTRKMMLLK